MRQSHPVVLLAFNGFELLDVTGPSSVFASANRLLGTNAYDVRVVSPGGGAIASNSGLEVVTIPIEKIHLSVAGTLLVAGADRGSMVKVMADPRLRQWLSKNARASGRFGSVCSGTYILAEAGLLSGKRVATHWASSESLAEQFRDIKVDAEALYAVDGRVWTSAGVTTGIDMALAMVESDVGSDLANALAKVLVLYMRRPGFQSQFSALLKTQNGLSTPFAELMNWMQAHLTHRLDVRSLAVRAGLSERSFYRRFRRATGRTPAQFVEALRLDAARALMGTGLPLKTIAGKTGLGTGERLSGAFVRRFGVAPLLFREMHFVEPGEPLPEKPPRASTARRPRRRRS